MITANTAYRHCIDMIWTQYVMRVYQWILANNSYLEEVFKTTYTWSFLLFALENIKINTIALQKMFCSCLLPTTDCREIKSHYSDQTHYSVPKPAHIYAHALHNKSGITCITALSNFEIFNRICVPVCFDCLSVCPEMWACCDWCKRTTSELRKLMYMHQNSALSHGL